MVNSLFPLHDFSGPAEEQIGPGAFLFRGFASEQEKLIVDQIEKISQQAPFRNMTTRSGFEMSVAMTNCGQAGWVSDRKGYRYETHDPKSGLLWPAMPELFQQLANQAAAKAGFPDFQPDVCLINRYSPGTKLSLHQDKDEKSFEFPIVSVSLGLSARFLFGGITRTEKPKRYELFSGDVVVWGAESRLAFHGVEPLADGKHPLTGGCRLNLTFRRATA